MDLMRYREEYGGARPALIMNQGRKWMTLLVVDNGSTDGSGDCLERELAGPIHLVLTGPGGGTWRLSPSSDAIEVSAASSDSGPVAATLTSSAHDFVLWGTTRLPWRQACTVDGDEFVVARFLDALNIV